MTPEQRDFATRALNFMGENEWAWYVLLGFVAYEFIGSGILAVFQLKWGDRKKHPEFSFGLLLTWELLIKTTFDIVGLFRNLVRWFLPGWALKIVEGVGLLPKDVKLTPDSQIPTPQPPESKP